MTREYFVDTWFLIALTDRSDSHHRRALQIDRRLRGQRLVTHDGVLTELLAFYSGAGAAARALAAAAVRDALRAYDVVPATRDLFLRALSRYELRGDKGYSLVDCMSMVLMEERGIAHVLTNDHHFRQEGFTVVSE